MGSEMCIRDRATAFSSSLFGLSGSLVIGFLDLQLGQAMGRFFTEVEDWLSAFAKFSDQTSSRSHGGQQALAQGLSEEGARAMITLASAIDAAQRDRTEQTRQITSLNTTLAVLSEQMADDRRLREQLAQLNIQIQQLTSSLDEKARLQQETVSTELRALSTAIVKLAGKK